MQFIVEVNSFEQIIYIKYLSSMLWSPFSLADKTLERQFLDGEFEE